MKKLLLFILPFCLLADENFFFDLGLTVGYRQDRYKTKNFDLDNPVGSGVQDLLVIDNEKNIRSVDLEAFLKMYIIDCFFLRFDGDFGWPQTGDTTFTLLLPFPSTNVFEFKPTTKVNGGKLFDVDGSVGIMFNLLPQRFKQKLLFIPQAGYSISYQRLKRKNRSPSSSENRAFGSTGFIDPNFQEARMRITWWGPFIGADLSTDPRKRWYFEAGYFYHFFTLKYLFNYPDIEFTSSPAIFAPTLLSFTIRGKSKNAFGHQARARCTYHFMENWALGFSGNYFFLDGRKNKVEQFNASVLQSGSMQMQNRMINRNHFHYFFSVLLDIVYQY